MSVFTQEEGQQRINSYISLSALINLIYMDTVINQTFSILIFGDNIIMMETVERKTYILIQWGALKKLKNISWASYVMKSKVMSFQLLACHHVTHLLIDFTFSQ